jgi:hypothetical protein
LAGLEKREAELQVGQEILAKFAVELFEPLEAIQEKVNRPERFALALLHRIS